MTSSMSLITLIDCNYPERKFLFAQQMVLLLYLGIHSAFRAWVKTVNPVSKDNHCMIHRYALASTTLPSDLKLVLDDVATMVINSGNNSRSLEVVCSDQVSDIIRRYHDSAAHPGINTTIKSIKHEYFWPGMSKDARNYVQSCRNCQLTAALPPQPQRELQPSPPPTNPGSTSLLIWSVICKRILKGLSRFSPQTKADNRETTAYHPQSNGLVEAHNKIIKTKFHEMLVETGAEWPSKLHAAVLAANTCWKKSTDYSPFYLMYGREANCSLLLTILTCFILRRRKNSTIYNCKLLAMKKMMIHSLQNLNILMVR
ncbi:hypothetical protein LOD99_10768 [Oopsacas minuta]|uniref:Integrase zinc-binding domain-containing protein n=1 Tax=Oopsacas minuta TaxID=111878 RepID=A0AAV7KD78_9METZ|nr:hypothetical protein LOD99_10768 [Oopsacas minuta]